jgi:hypothetical protein
VPPVPALATGAAGGQGARALIPNPSQPEADDHAAEAEWSRADVRDAGRALRQRWPLSPERRQQLVDALHFIATTNLIPVDPRARVAAAKACIDADKLNLEVEKRQPRGPDQIQENGRTRWDFSAMTDEDLRQFIESGGAESE